MDACGSFIVAASAPLEVRVLRVHVHGGAPNMAGRPSATISVVRELSIMSVGQPLRVRLPRGKPLGWCSCKLCLC